MKSLIKNRSLPITRQAATKLAVYALLGCVFSWGNIQGTAGYAAGMLISAVSGWQHAAAAAAGAAIGSVTLPNGVLHAAVSAGLFAIRLLLGRWLSEKLTQETDVPKVQGNAGIGLRAVHWLKRRAAAAFYEPIFVRMTFALAACLVYGGICCYLHGYSTRLLVSAAVAAAISPLAVYLYYSAVDGSGELLREAGICAVLATAVFSLRSDASPADLSLCAAFVISVVVASVKGASRGVIYGIVCGAAGSIPLSPMYALSALVCRALIGFSPALAVSGACLVCCVWSVYALGMNAMGDAIPTIVITSALLAPIMSSEVLRGRMTGGTKSAVSKADGTATLLQRRESTRRMKGLSRSMSDLSAMLYRLSEQITSPDTEQLCELCTGVFDQVCKGCGMKSACYGAEEERTEAVQAKMTAALRRDGRVSASVVPSHLAKRCYNMGTIIDRLNSSYTAAVSEARLYDRTSVVAADYEVMSEMLRESSEYDTDEYELDRDATARMLARMDMRLPCDSIGIYGSRVKKVIARGVKVSETTPDGDAITEELSYAAGLELSHPEFELAGKEVIMRLSALPRYSVRCGRASVAASAVGGKGRGASPLSSTRIFTPGDKTGTGKTASAACGDVISAFLTGDGRFFMLISDGMGSGREASLTSGICAVFIEKLLTAGATMDTSLKMLNSMLRVRGMEVSATVDLMELDLMNGCARFVKSGAAPSFVLRDGRLFRLQSKTVPIGIVRALDAEMIKFDTRVGDIIVMLSDGVVRSFEDCPWLYDMLCDAGNFALDAEKLARRIVECAIQNGADDDITAGVIVLDER